MIATHQIPKDSDLSTHVIRKEAELWSLASEWKNLFRSTECNDVFLSFEWLSQWWAHFGRKFRLFLVMVRATNGHLVALAPLYIATSWRPLPLRRLGLIGDRLVGSDHLGFLVEKAFASQALQSIQHFIVDHRREWDFIEFTSSSSDSDAFMQFEKMMEAAQMTIHRTVSSSCPYFHLPGATEEYWSSLRPRLRKNLRYQTRSLEREGQLNFVTIEDVSRVETAMDDLLRLHQLRSERRGRHSTFLDPKVTPFHRDAVQALVAEGEARIFFLELSGKRIAALYGFSTGRKFSYYQSGADPAYSRFGVGTLLISSVIEWAIRNGYREFDFLRGDEPYKQLWATQATQLHDLTFFDCRAKSRLAQTIRVVRNSLHDWKAALVRRGTPSSEQRAQVATTAL
ncbi:MAG TPA: GNAT family N-acetyltransferase [Candidatus Binatia bacterium]|nr:GNAT family N-acetyltransferase [Candidatus Binatia bacterium]